MEEEKPEQGHYIRIKRFQFIMIVFALVFVTAAVTTITLAFGDEKAVEVGAPARSEFNKLYEAYDTIESQYFKDVDQEKLVNGAINGMIDALEDPYSDYMNKEEASQFHEDVSSSFQGIGAEVQEQDGFIMVVSPIKGSPAEKAGLKPNDMILSVDNKSIQGMSASEAVLLIRGEKGTKVKLEVQKAGSEKTQEITIVRDEIPIETVYSEIGDNKIAHIQITSFSEHTAEELTKALKDMEAKGMEGIVLDLRQNPGGLLDQAIKMANLFVPEGKNILQVENSNGEVQVFKAEGGEKIKLPAAVLIDSGSASASEILAAALNESAGIPLFGEKTFGKGTVQSAEDFSDKSNLKLTTAKWLTPNGTWIHEKGIQPDSVVKLPEYASLSYINPESKLILETLSDEVKTAEQMLTALGYDPGKADGYFDEHTESAIEEFQEESGIEPTGVLTGASTTKLMEQLRIKLQENDTQLLKAIESVKSKLK
ncbi:lmo1851 family serine protease [Domibacillus epiphyticus]|uniref:C-terminal processing peptidase n=1 Tax=Domibacillus epiphyticus TaxID=1714355 RepID=A0A1V2A3W3_9BACI|nr:S41 family peptidase [Domibacillus epiphyticus]OMP65686.1 peptidase S41 [Domibacillus epiphyticus]